MATSNANWNYNLVNDPGLATTLIALKRCMALYRYLASLAKAGAWSKSNAMVESV